MGFSLLRRGVTWLSHPHKLMRTHVFQILKLRDAATLNPRRLASALNVEMGADGSPKFSSVVELCDHVRAESSLNLKTKAFCSYFNAVKYKSTSEAEAEVNILTALRLLIPFEVPRKFQMKEKKLIKLMAALLNVDHTSMEANFVTTGSITKVVEDVTSLNSRSENFERTILQIDATLTRLELCRGEQEQSDILEELILCWPQKEIGTVINIIMLNLQMKAKTAVVLAAFGKDAHSEFKHDRNFERLVRSFVRDSITDSMSQLLGPGRPASPMLAKPAKSIEEGFNNCKEGCFAELKYDGERIQVHNTSSGQTLFYSRNLKPTSATKVGLFEKVLHTALPKDSTYILDCEIVMVDHENGDIHPFGSLGVHKQKLFKNARPCLVVFDVLFFRGRSTLDLPLWKRRALLEENLEIRNSADDQAWIVLSKLTEISTLSQLKKLFLDTVNNSEEGLMLKDKSSTYILGQRKWWKLKRDHIGTSMSDTADLMVLGGYYGKGKKGGKISSLLLGCCIDRRASSAANANWKTVARVANVAVDIDDALAAVLVETSEYHGDIKWLDLGSYSLPDFILREPQLGLVCEVNSAEFIESSESSSSISLRHPRLIRSRMDKDWRTSTSLDELEALQSMSKR